MHQVEMQDEPGADVRFGLARERFAADDDARRAWLDAECRKPDPAETARSLPKWKEHAPADGRCRRWGCKRGVRCKGLCATHYWQERWEARKEREAARDVPAPVQSTEAA